MWEKAWSSRFVRTAEEKKQILKNYGVHVLQREEQQKKIKEASLYFWHYKVILRYRENILPPERDPAAAVARVHLQGEISN
mgnify:CR=1 FL=1